MREIHYNIDEAVVCGDGLNIITGESDAGLSFFALALFSNTCLVLFPEGDGTSREIRQRFECVAKLKANKHACIVTRSLFVMREAHMLQKEHGYPVRWFYLKADGSFHQADSMDYIGQCEALDEEVMQAERYMNLEMNLKPRESK